MSASAEHLASDGAPSGPPPRRDGPRELLVLAGPQAGARVPLPRDVAVTVGNALEHDVVVYTGATSERWTLRLTRRRDRVDGCLLEGEITCGDVPLGRHEVTTFEPGATFAVDGARFSLPDPDAPDPDAPDGEASDGDAAADATSTDGAGTAADRSAGRDDEPSGERATGDPTEQRTEGATDGTAADAEPEGGIDLDVDEGEEAASPTSTVARAPASARRRFAILACVLAGLVPIGYAAWLESRATHDARLAEARSVPFGERLADAGLGELSYLPADGEQGALVSGRVPTRAARTAIGALAAEAGLEPIVDVQIDDEMAEQIADVYRVNGVAAEVEVTGIGTAEVSTGTDRLDLLERIETELDRDMPHLASLVARNTVPEAPAIEVEPVADDDPNKTVTLVVAGPDGYLMTRDLARYFVGSLLPSGHTVKRIADGRVTLVRDGEETTLEF